MKLQSCLGSWDVPVIHRPTAYGVVGFATVSSPIVLQCILLLHGLGKMKLAGM